MCDLRFFNKNTYSAIRAFVVTLIISIYSASAFASVNKASEQACEQTIQDATYQNILPACMNILGNKTYEQALVNQNFTSYLGTLENLSSSGKLLFSRAKKGDKEAQFALATNMSILNPEPGNTSKWYGRLSDERQKWLMKAADQGHVQAMISFIEYLTVGSELLSEKVHNTGRRYAQSLVASQTSASAQKYDHYLSFFNTMAHEDNWQQILQEKLDNLSTLSSQEIRDMAMDFLTGNYRFFYHSDTDFLIGTRTIRFSVRGVRDLETYERLTQYLADNRAHPESSYQAALTHFFDEPKNLERAFEYLNVAIEGRYPKALTFVGRYLICHQKIDSGKAFLNEAIKVGDVNAKDELSDLNQYGDLYNCPKVPSNSTFIEKHLIKK